MVILWEWNSNLKSHAEILMFTFRPFFVYTCSALIFKFHIEYNDKAICIISTACAYRASSLDKGIICKIHLMTIAIFTLLDQVCLVCCLTDLFLWKCVNHWINETHKTPCKMKEKNFSVGKLCSLGCKGVYAVKYKIIWDGIQFEH